MLGADDFFGSDRIVVSGAMHYFRTLPQQWPHRLRMLRAMGVNCVETYVPWNLHQRRRGEFDFTGMADVEAFLDVAAAQDLPVLVRPGPYICAEWENGGLPAWLRAADRHAPLRCHDPAFLEAVGAWFDVLLPKIVARQITRGGNVAAVQVENEYGSYGSDSRYLRWLTERIRAAGVDVALFTSDGPQDSMLTAGMIDGVEATVNFGSDPEAAFAALRRRRPEQREWCMEYWNGWFDHWGESHHVRDPADAAATLDRMLRRGASVNIYMAHGGTNFGVWAGANHDGVYQPTVTSYDYDAPVDERGAPTAKFHAFRDVIARHLPVGADVPEPAPLLPPQTVELSQQASLRSLLPHITPRRFATPPVFEQLGMDNGLAWYRHRLRGPREADALSVDGLADRAQLYLDGVAHAVWERDANTSVELAVDADVDVELLVESMGRVNYGPLLGECKGVTGGVFHGGRQLHDWTVFPIPLDDLPAAVSWGAGGDAVAAGPQLRRGWLRVDDVGDAYVALPDWTKGYVWVNGFCLGRYWDRGPQRTLYLPWPLLFPGDNEIVVLELHPGAERNVEIRDRADLGPVASAPPT